MKIFFWTMVAVVAGIFVYSQLTRKKGGLFSKKNPAPGTTYRDMLGNTMFAGPDVDTVTGAHLPPDAKPGTVEFPAQNN